MELKWTQAALADLARLYEFLAPADRRAAARLVHALVAAPETLLAHPRLSEKLEEFAPREVRRILAGPYEIRYEVRDATIFVLRVWHTREER
ncbi:MAG: type II toxin-antitoxin system RelE/ParE family toxin [Acidimicrobiia bacterium]|nr:type II toxin-antitoxin system RelE/ParE family toxin [Acidimicrobiia bacterium]